MSIEKRYHKTRKEREDKELHRDRFVFTFFRNLNIEGMRCYYPVIERCKLYRLQTYPDFYPNYAKYIDSGGEVQLDEKLVSASAQEATLLGAFGAEGLVVFFLSDREAEALQRALDNLEFHKLRGDAALAAVEKLPTAGKEAIKKSVDTALRYARSILDTTRMEAEMARTVRRGKSYLDDRDLQCCWLLGIPESSVLSSEGSARNQMVADLVNALRGNSANNEIERLKAEINELKSRLQATVS